MKTDNYFLKISSLFLVLSIVTHLSCKQSMKSGPTDKEAVSAAANESRDTGGLAPIVIDTNTPLLLDEPDDDQKAFAARATQAANENSACFVCHGNYRTEFIVNRHAQVNIGCSNCHGGSSAHQNDENNITPPEILYASETINSFCRRCHTAHIIKPRAIVANYLMKKSEKRNTSCLGKDCHKTDDVPPEMVVTRLKERKLEGIEPDKIVCTDCHGDHRMKVRTIIWDKNTGKLLSTNKGD